MVKININYHSSKLGDGHRGTGVDGRFPVEENIKTDSNVNVLLVL